MEEEAELVLLEQRLQQTNRLAGRMTTLLSQLDTRLSRLDKTVAPFGIQELTKEASNIDIALSILAGEKVPTQILKSGNNADYSAIGKHEEEVISKMPSYSSFDEYTSAINRVLKEIDRLSKNELRSSSGLIKDYARLVDLGARNLSTLFGKFCRDAAGKVPDMERLVQKGPQDPASSLPTLPLLTRLLTYLSSLPITPTHPTSKSTLTHLQSIKNTYLTTRRDWVANMCLGEGVVREFDQISEGPMSPGREEEGRRGKCGLVRRGLEGVLVLMQSELALIEHLFPNTSPTSMLLPIFTHPLQILSDLLSTQTSLIKRSLSSQSFYALELYQTLSSLQQDWEEVTGELFGGGEEEMVMQRMVGEGAAGLRQACLRSFPEILVDVRAPLSGSSRDVGSSSVADITYTTVTYLENLPAYEAIVIDLLTSVGDRNWLMGAAPTSQQSSSAGEDGILQHFIADLLAALIGSLETRSKAMRRPVNSIYMLNNLCYMRNNLVLSNNSAAGDILGVAAEDILNNAYREAKARYLDAWQELVGMLPESSSGGTAARFGVGGDKQAVKDSLTNFFNRLDELEGVAKQHSLSRQDPNLRERLYADVRNLVVPAFSNFVARHPKYADKYARSSPSDVEARLAALVR